MKQFSARKLVARLGGLVQVFRLPQSGCTHCGAILAVSAAGFKPQALLFAPQACLITILSRQWSR
jgi:hypothetical protein